MQQSFLVLILISLVIILWFWALIDIARSRFISTTMNLVWLVFVLFCPVIGTMIYLLVRKNYITKEKRSFQPEFNRSEK